MRGLTHGFAFALLLPLMAGCAAPGLLLAPLAPRTLGRRVEQRQEVTFSYHGHTRSFQAALKVAPQNLTLIGLTAIGQRLFTLSWNGRAIRFKSSLNQLKHFEPKQVLADLELAYWPLPVLRAALPKNLRLETIGTARILWRGDTLLWFASSGGPDRWTTPVTIYNARRGYRLHIRPLGIY
jgi:hypothetical protein